MKLIAATLALLLSASTVFAKDFTTCAPTKDHVTASITISAHTENAVILTAIRKAYEQTAAKFEYEALRTAEGYYAFLEALTDAQVVDYLDDVTTPSQVDKCE